MVDGGLCSTGRRSLDNSRENFVYVFCSLCVFFSLPKLVRNFHIQLYVVSLAVILHNGVCDNWVYQFPTWVSAAKHYELLRQDDIDIANSVWCALLLLFFFTNQGVSEYGWKSDWENRWALIRSHSWNQPGEPTVLGDSWKSCDGPWFGAIPETNRESQQYSRTALTKVIPRFLYFM